MKIIYQRKQFRPASLDVIDQANTILLDYAAQGFDLTLRQLYYQFVSRALIPNRDAEYKKLGSIINDARLAGLVDWDHITDRTRNLKDLPHWSDPADVIESTTRFFRTDLWDDQDYRIEVWIEKDALAGVIEPTCQALDVPFFSCRGYTSQSEMWAASQRLLGYILDGKKALILHLGDHDPSGIDMTRDIKDRLRMFVRQDYVRNHHDELRGLSEVNQRVTITQMMDRVDEALTVKRLALNMDQIDQYQPPPNPAKVTDSRAREYILDYGSESWELDALEPTVLAALIRDAIEEHMDADRFEAAVEQEEKYRGLLRESSQRWLEIEEFLNGDPS